MIFSPSAENAPDTTRLCEPHNTRGTPCVLLDRDLSDRPMDGVYIDNEKASFLAVEKFKDCGHSDIALIVCPTDTRPGRDRKMGFIQAMKYFELPVCDEFIKEGGTTVESGYECARELFSGKKRPTAVFTANNTMTLGFASYMFEAGMLPGRDVALIAFDEVAMFDIIHMPVTTITRSSYQMGVLAMQMLLEKMKRPSGDDPPSGSVNIIPKLISRGTEVLKKL